MSGTAFGDPGCPCGSARPRTACCGPLLDGDRTARTAEELMRSRYTAFALGDAGYLVRTWHPRTRPADLDSLERHRRRWTGLRVLRAEAGGPQDAEGLVEFEADYLDGGRRGAQHEVSRFVRRGGRWVYLEAVDPSPTSG